MHFDSAQRISAVFGMILIVMMQIRSDEVYQTIVLAGIGGLSSYLVTLGVKFLISYLKKRF